MSLSTLRYLPGGLFPWQTFTPLASKINLWGNIPWVFLGLLGVYLPALAQDTTICRKDAGARPGAWAQLVATLLLLAVSFSLATWQLYTRGSSTETVGSVAPPPHGHSHHPGVYHHGAIISPAGQ